MFARKGYAAARLDEIAAEAGFTKGAVYSNFSGKHALLVELVQDQVRDEFTQRASEVRGRNRPAQAVDDMAEAFARSLVERPVLTRLLVEIGNDASRDPEVHEVYQDVRRSLRAELTRTLEQAVERLGLSPVAPVEQIVVTMQALRLGLALEHGTDPERVDLEVITAVFRDTLRSLLRGPEGARREPVNSRPGQ